LGDNNELVEWVKLFLETHAKSQEKISQSLAQNQVEIKESVVRVHERLDQFLGRDYIQRSDCEKYRSSCVADLRKQIKGVPVVTAAAITVAVSLTTGILTYYFTAAAKIVTQIPK